MTRSSGPATTTAQCEAVLDEIGRMELKSDVFAGRVQELLERCWKDFFPASVRLSRLVDQPAGCCKKNLFSLFPAILKRC